MKNKFALTLLAGTLWFDISTATQPGETMTFPVTVKAGWNLLSLPVGVANGSKASLFPTAVSDAFSYETGYLPMDTIVTGKGFWLKFPFAETVEIDGEPLFIQTVHLDTGWNLIGNLATAVSVENIRTEPDDILVSRFFGYSAGYHETDTLQPGSGYWVKTSREGTLSVYTVNVPCPGISTVEYSGKSYATVQIGEQCWFRENLDIGTMIPGNQYGSDNGTVEKYCYMNDPQNCEVYGGLYLWREAMHYDTASQGICPTGWHIPRNSEFGILASTVGDDAWALEEVGERSGTNTTGFSALLAGQKWYADFGYGWFGSLGHHTNIWSSTETGYHFARAMYLGASAEIRLGFETPSWDDGASIRCLREGV